MLNTQKNKLLLTGGHAGVTAYALVQEILKTHPDWEIHWIGSDIAVEGTSAKTIEAGTLPKLGVEIHSIRAGRIQRRFTRWTIPSLLKIPLGFFDSARLIKKISPTFVLSFGGFAAFPVTFVSWLFRIPVVIHEQTATAGRANIYSSFFANKIAISRDSSRKYFPENKTVLTGNPVSEKILSIKPKGHKSSPPVVFITGGSRGSSKINTVVRGALNELLERFSVIHQTGELEYNEHQSLKESLSLNQKERYTVYPVLTPEEWSEVLQECDIVIARSGANFVSELLIVKKPAILIPIPWSFNDEQAQNAKIAKEWGIAEILTEEELSPKKLVETVNKLDRDWKIIIDKVKDQNSPDVSASKKLLELLESVL